MYKQRSYNFNSIGDLFEYRKYLLNEIDEYSKRKWYMLDFRFAYYYLYCFKVLQIVNLAIKKKGYNV